MPVTNYPAGLASFGVPLLGAGPLGVVTTGRIMFVDSAAGNDSPWNDSSGQGGDPSKAFATISFAITQARSSKGDVIYVLPGHAETIATATTLTLNKIGVQIIGLGFGANRPTITFNGTASNILISAASTALRNVILAAGIDEIVTAVSVSANYCMLERVDVNEVTSKQFIQFALITGTDCIVQGCRHFQATAPAANTLWIQLQGAHRAQIIGNQVFITTTNSASSSVVESDTTAPLNVFLQDNRFVQLGGVSTIPINMMAATSGFASGNQVASQKTAIAGSIALASMYGALNYANHVVNKNGLLEPVVDA
jgi:hypothetical protein